MTLLHAHFHLRNLQAFQRLLDSGNDRGTHTAVSGSAGKSWKGANALKSVMACDVNALDWLGRTPLHIASAAPDAIEYVRALLKHPSINVNLPDVESRSTALHRALYNGNLAAALLLLQRSDIDLSLKDFEGHTPFDLYNTTVSGTAPHSGLACRIVYMGNAALGLVDSGDRTYPDQVSISKEGPEPNSTARFSPLLARQIQMSKLHTVVVTSENKSNLRLCGFGSGGRLGPGQHTQYSLVPLHQLPHSIVAVALGQDHTLALTSGGEVLSWGLSRFHQLGYVVEPSTTSGRLEEPIQASPRKIYGPLKKEIVKGVAASKQSSACWTATEVFTWGTNNGQLGYDKAAQPFQIIPRKVSKVVRPVLAISLTDHAMACLLDTQDVVCIWNDRYIKINFPVHAFPSEIQPYRPPQAMKLKDAHIAKITSSEDTFAALSSNGELFTFSVTDPSETDANAGRGSGFKPQRVWALRKQFSAVRDVALGADGSIIICTESGHVFVRTRSGKAGQGSGAASNKTFKFQRVPFIQRVTQVCANTTGAFGALRVDFKPEPIRIEGNTMAEDLATVRPYTASPPAVHLRDESVPVPDSPQWSYAVGDEGEEPEDAGIETDFRRIWHLCKLLEPRDNALPARCGADIMVQVRAFAFPTHRAILGARSPVLCGILEGSALRDAQSHITIKAFPASGLAKARLELKGCEPITVLILLDYLYSDELLAIWDRRLASALQRELATYKIKPGQVKLELQALARVLNLPLLAQALESPAKRVAAPSVVRDMEQLFRAVQLDPNTKSDLAKSPIAADVVLQLADRDVHCHSTVLRARSPVFASFFDEADWTAKRWEVDGTVKVNLKHMRWHVMEYVLKHMCCGGDAEIFENLEFARSVDEILEFMFDVMAAATELLLDRLVLLCSSVILRWTDINNACYILTDAAHFHAQQLVESIMGYMTANMETLLESRMLDDLTPALVKQLSKFVARKQKEKSPKVRSNFIVDRALAIHEDWLALQDIPEVIVPSSRFPARKDAPTSPTTAKRRQSGTASLSSSPVIAAQTSTTPHSPKVQSSNPGIDDIFEMDDTELALPAPSIPTTDPVPSTSTAPVWKASSTPRVDMKTIMAEAASQTVRRPHDAGEVVRVSYQKTPQRERRKLQGSADPFDGPSTPGSSRSASSPWKLPPARPTLNPPSNSPPITPSTSLSRPQEAFPTLPATAAPPATPPRSRAPQPPPTCSGTCNHPVATAHFSHHHPDGNKAWTQPPPAPVAAPSPANVSGMSLVAIQQLQLEQGTSPGKDKRSLREIQEEEKARQAEEDFLKWWAAEEERVKAEAEALAHPPRNVPKSTRRNNKKPRNRPSLPGPMLSSA
ncbi:hypothetical protein MSAN_01039400 [Mycena sanguinolenta]|uniref:BTB domain-containing protein n=1 Tax=Mycena sanguinolenta TaxID=230812 RepID=A0A8H6YTX4_9AGAR|nr:hypothetical protein MSAN_01039400 [Mycena sanguinolenta]